MAPSEWTHRGGSSTERALKCCAPPRTHNSRIANRRLEREAAEASSDRGPDLPGSDFRSRGCAAALQVGVKMQKRSRGLSHGRSLLTVPRACLQTTEPRTPRPPHRPGPERAGPDRQPPRILTPLHRSAGVGVLSPRHPSKNQEREPTPSPTLCPAPLAGGPSCSSWAWNSGCGRGCTHAGLTPWMWALGGSPPFPALVPGCFLVLPKKQVPRPNQPVLVPASALSLWA
uniref:Uncharacterized protein n=1 Tax=Piliocolobus tephrosceles TaxID=591936 RepID=A0A8C9IFB0_9PRIM